MRRLSRLPALLVACLAMSANAQDGTIYRYRTPDGKTTYSNRPPAKGESAEVVRERATTVPADRPARQGSANQGVPTAPSSGRGSKLDEAMNKVRDATEALRNAERLRDEGKEQLPGERLSTSSGGSRLSEDYFERQKSLESGVRDAKEQLDRALRQRNELR